MKEKLSKIRFLNKFEINYRIIKLISINKLLTSVKENLALIMGAPADALMFDVAQHWYNTFWVTISTRYIC